MFDVARLIGDSLREAKSRDGPYLMQSNIDSSASFLVGGQIRGEPPRLFNVYSEGNFIEATADTCYFQSGETKYGKPIIDRVITRRASLIDATKCTMVSFDSTMRSNISVGLPIDLLVYQTDSLRIGMQRRIDEDDPYLPDGPPPVGRRAAPGVRAAAEPRLDRLMAIRVALQHRTTYRFDRNVGLGPHEIRLRPAPHCRTPILGYSLNVTPDKYFLNWQQDPYGNWVARLVFTDRADELDIRVDLTADMTVINPFDFFVEEYARSHAVRLRAGARQGADSVPRDGAGGTAARRVARALPADDRRRARRRSTCWCGSTSSCSTRSAISCGWSRACSRRTRRSSGRRAPAATPAGCSCRSCATWASRRASPRGT